MSTGDYARIIRTDIEPRGPTDLALRVWDSIGDLPTIVPRAIVWIPYHLWRIFQLARDPV